MNCFFLSKIYFIGLYKTLDNFWNLISYSVVRIIYWFYIKLLNILMHKSVTVIYHCTKPLTQIAQSTVSAVHLLEVPSPGGPPAVAGPRLGVSTVAVATWSAGVIVHPGAVGLEVTKQNSLLCGIWRCAPNTLFNSGNNILKHAHFFIIQITILVIL